MPQHDHNLSSEMLDNFFGKIDIPRRARLDLMTPAEKAIYDAMQEVEKAGADVRLTDAINLLDKAKDMVSDFVDGIE